MTLELDARQVCVVIPLDVTAPEGLAVMGMVRQVKVAMDAYGCLNYSHGAIEKMATRAASTKSYSQRRTLLEQMFMVPLKVSLEHLELYAAEVVPHPPTSPRQWSKVRNAMVSQLGPSLVLPVSMSVNIKLSQIRADASIPLCFVEAKVPAVECRLDLELLANLALKLLHNPRSRGVNAHSSCARKAAKKSLQQVMARQSFRAQTGRTPCGNTPSMRSICSSSLSEMSMFDLMTVHDGSPDVPDLHDLGPLPSAAGGWGIGSRDRDWLDSSLTAALSASASSHTSSSAADQASSVLTSNVLTSSAKALHSSNLDVIAAAAAPETMEGVLEQLGDNTPLVAHAQPEIVRHTTSHDASWHGVTHTDDQTPDPLGRGIATSGDAAAILSDDTAATLGVAVPVATQQLPQPALHTTGQTSNTSEAAAAASGWRSRWLRWRTGAAPPLSMPDAGEANEIEGAVCALDGSGGPALVDGCGSPASLHALASPSHPTLSVPQPVAQPMGSSATQAEAKQQHAIVSELHSQPSNSTPLERPGRWSWLKKMMPVARRQAIVSTMLQAQEEEDGGTSKLTSSCLEPALLSSAVAGGEGAGWGETREIASERNSILTSSTTILSSISTKLAATPGNASVAAPVLGVSGSQQAAVAGNAGVSAGGVCGLFAGSEAAGGEKGIGQGKRERLKKSLEQSLNSLNTLGSVVSSSLFNPQSSAARHHAQEMESANKVLRLPAATRLAAYQLAHDKGLVWQQLTWRQRLEHSEALCPTHTALMLPRTKSHSSLTGLLDPDALPRLRDRHGASFLVLDASNVKHVSACETVCVLPHEACVLLRASAS